MTTTIPVTRGGARERAARICAIVRGSVADGVLTREIAVYKLGNGGRRPDAEKPWDKQRRCDCSGFVAWALGYDRLQPDDMWINTDAILRGDAGMFEPVPAAAAVESGDVLVYGSTRQNGERRPGHVGLITALLAGFDRAASDWWLRVSVAHCSPGNSKRFGTGHAIAETDAKLWRRRGKLVRYRRFAG